jgi:hypothetical protein
MIAGANKQVGEVELWSSPLSSAVSISEYITRWPPVSEPARRSFWRPIATQRKAGAARLLSRAKRPSSKQRSSTGDVLRRWAACRGSRLRPEPRLPVCRQHIDKDLQVFDIADGKLTEVGSRPLKLPASRHPCARQPGSACAIVSRPSANRETPSRWAAAGYGVDRPRDRRSRRAG